MKQRNTDIWDRNGPRTKEVTAIFGLAYIRSKWALWGITYLTFQMTSITSNKGTCEPMPRNSVTANKITRQSLHVTSFVLLCKQIMVTAHRPIANYSKAYLLTDRVLAPASDELNFFFEKTQKDFAFHFIKKVGDCYTLAERFTSRFTK
jgi:hypothetical protein